MAKPKPKWGMKIKKIEDLKLLFEDHHVQDIATCTGIELSEEQQLRLKQITWRYLYTRENDWPKFKERRAAVLEIEKHARHLSRCLRTLDEPTRQYLIFLCNNQSGVLDEHDEQRYKDLRQELVLYRLFLKRVGRRLWTKRGGRPGREHLRLYIRCLSDLHFKLSGKTRVATYDDYSDEYKGDFFSFVLCCLKQTNDPYSRPSMNQALGEMIKAALKYRNR